MILKHKSTSGPCGVQTMQIGGHTTPLAGKIFNVKVIALNNVISGLLGLFLAAFINSVPSALLISLAID